MSKKKYYYDGIDALKSLLEQSGQKGEWTEHDNCYQFRSQHGGILNYWPGTNTVNVQGKSPGKEALEALLDCGMAEKTVGSAQKVSPSKKIFVVYGHDRDVRSQLDSMLRRWSLEPVILDELPSKGQTIIEKLEGYTEDIGFGVVLATPDDLGYRKDHENEKAYRARQNVVLELGMLLVKLGRPRVAILLSSQVDMERPSDIQGLIYIPFKSDLQKEAGLTNSVGYEARNLKAFDETY